MFPVIVIWEDAVCFCLKKLATNCIKFSLPSLDNVTSYKFLIGQHITFLEHQNEQLTREKWRILAAVFSAHIPLITPKLIYFFNIVPVGLSGLLLTGRKSGDSEAAVSHCILRWNLSCCSLQYKPVLCGPRCYSQQFGFSPPTWSCSSWICSAAESAAHPERMRQKTVCSPCFMMYSQPEHVVLRSTWQILVSLDPE